MIYEIYSDGICTFKVKNDNNTVIIYENVIIPKSENSKLNAVVEYKTNPLEFHQEVITSGNQHSYLWIKFNDHGVLIFDDKIYIVKNNKMKFSFDMEKLESTSSPSYIFGSGVKLYHSLISSTSEFTEIYRKFNLTVDYGTCHIICDSENIVITDTSGMKFVIQTDIRECKLFNSNSGILIQYGELVYVYACSILMRYELIKQPNCFNIAKVVKFTCPDNSIDYSIQYENGTIIIGTGLYMNDQNKFINNIEHSMLISIVRKLGNKVIMDENRGNCNNCVVAKIIPAEKK